MVSWKKSNDASRPPGRWELIRVDIGVFPMTKTSPRLGHLTPHTPGQDSDAPQLREAWHTLGPSNEISGSSLRFDARRRQIYTSGSRASTFSSMWSINFWSSNPPARRFPAVSIWLNWDERGRKLEMKIVYKITELHGREVLIIHKEAGLSAPNVWE